MRHQCYQYRDRIQYCQCGTGHPFDTGITDTDSFPVLILHLYSNLQKQQKPAYIEICCNLASLTHPSFTDPPIPIALAQSHTNAGKHTATTAVAVSMHEPL